MDLATAQANLDAAVSAHQKALSAASYSVGNRATARQTITDLRAAIDYWQRVVRELTAEAQGHRPGLAAIATFNWCDTQ